MLKPQDIMLLLKLLSRSDESRWSQNKLATHLCISASEVNAGIKRLSHSSLLRQQLTKAQDSLLYLPIIPACEEFLIHAVKYILPVLLGEYTRGIATSYAAPIFKGKINLGQDPIPVWPFVEGRQRGIALKPLYVSIPKSLTEYPDQRFYDFLALVDAIRQGRAREREFAIKILRERLK